MHISLIDFPERLDPAKIKEVRIHPKYDARFFEVEYISEGEIEAVETVKDSTLAIDLEVIYKEKMKTDKFEGGSF